MQEILTSKRTTFQSYRKLDLKVLLVVLLEDWEQALVRDTFHLWLSTISTQGAVLSTPWNALIHHPGSRGCYIMGPTLEYRQGSLESYCLLQKDRDGVSNRMLGFWVPLPYILTSDSIGICLGNSLLREGEGL